MLLKTRLHEHLFQLLEIRISTLTAQRTQMSHDSTASGKGSAGDKHEVGIAMAQLEIEKIEEGALVDEGEFLVFKKDVLFKSPSGASDVVAGASTNGWVLWKSGNGKTLDELKRQDTANKSVS